MLAPKQIPEAAMLQTKCCPASQPGGLERSCRNRRIALRPDTGQVSRHQWLQGRSHLLDRCAGCLRAESSGSDSRMIFDCQLFGSFESEGPLRLRPAGIPNDAQPKQQSAGMGFQNHQAGNTCPEVDL